MVGGYGFEYWCDCFPDHLPKDTAVQNRAVVKGTWIVYPPSSSTWATLEQEFVHDNDGWGWMGRIACDCQILVSPLLRLVGSVDELLIDHDLEWNGGAEFIVGGRTRLR